MLIGFTSADLDHMPLFPQHALLLFSYSQTSWVKCFCHGLPTLPLFVLLFSTALLLNTPAVFSAVCYYLPVMFLSWLFLETYILGAEQKQPWGGAEVVHAQIIPGRLKFMTYFLSKKNKNVLKNNSGSELWYSQGTLCNTGRHST